MIDTLRDARNKVVGSKQVLRSVREGKVALAFIARDADPFVTRQVADACEKAHVKVIEVDEMALIGKACGLSVRSATAGILKG